MNSTYKVKQILIDEFSSAKMRNPNYSMRAYAKRIGMPQSAVSEIIAGKRPLTQKSAYKILTGLDKSPNEISQLLFSQESPAKTFTSLDMDSYHLISDWYYYAILSLAETDDFQSHPKWIARRLGIEETVAKNAIERLVRLDMLHMDPKSKKLIPTGESFEAISEVANAALKKANRENLELAIQKMQETTFEERDYTAITLCFNPNKMLEARRMIKNFRRAFCKEMEINKKQEVYKLCIQLFPLTKKGPT